MINDLKIGQVLWLKVKYQTDKFGSVTHPMLISKIEDSYIEVIALDKTAGKMHNLFRAYNKYINVENPRETVIYEDSYVQFNTKIILEKFSELTYFRKTKDTLSKLKLKEIIDEYYEYQSNNIIDENRKVYMTKEEILSLNKLEIKV